MRKSDPRSPAGANFRRAMRAHVVEQAQGALFPMRLGPPDLRQESEDFYVAHTLDAALHTLHAQMVPGAEIHPPPPPA